MASKVIAKMQEKAEQLWTLRKKIAYFEEEMKNDIDNMKRERDALQNDLLTQMDKNGLVSFKVKSGDSLYKGTRKSIEVTNEVFALKWAKENNAYSINKILVAQKLKDLPEVPNGFEIVESNFISVRKAKSKDND